MKLNGQEVNKIILGVRSSTVQTKTIDESGARKIMDDEETGFICPKSNQVIVGRAHLGDENGKTTYKYGELSFLNDDYKEYEFELSDVFYSNYFSEKDSCYACPEGALIVGREHIGDENGKTRYAYKKLYVKKKNYGTLILCKICSEMQGEHSVKESSGEWSEYMITVERDIKDPEPEKTYYAPMYGRDHKGDENGKTTTYFACMELTTGQSQRIAPQGVYIWLKNMMNSKGKPVVSLQILLAFLNKLMCLILDNHTIIVCGTQRKPIRNWSEIHERTIQGNTQHKAWIRAEYRVVSMHQRVSQQRKNSLRYPLF